MDSIRARGLLRYRYCYNPPSQLQQIVKEILSKSGFNMQDSWKSQNLNSRKEKILSELGTQLNHFIPNSSLHKIKTVGDLFEFYSTPVSNLPKYTQMSREESAPENLYIREQPIRFHPNDIHSPHGGITAFPGTGGKVLGLRNKRLYRQFNPKKEWFEFEEQSFSYEAVDKDMPWDPEMVQKMDREVNKKFSAKSLQMKKI